MVFYSVKRGRWGKRDSELRDRGGGDGGPGADGGRCGNRDYFIIIIIFCLS